MSVRRGSKARRILDGILEVCNIATGLAVCGMQDLQHGCTAVDMDERSTSASDSVNVSSSTKKKGHKKKKKIRHASR